MTIFCMLVFDVSRLLPDTPLIPHPLLDGGLPIEGNNRISWFWITSRFPVLALRLSYLISYLM